MRQQLPILLVAAFLATPSAAQWFSDRPAQCPVGTALSSKGTCVKSSGRPAANQTTSLPKKASDPGAAKERPAVVPAAKTSGGACPKGAFPVKTKRGAICVPIAEGGEDAREACSNFNGGFSGWYRSQAAEYEDLAKRNRDEEAAMARNIDRQQALESELRRSVFRARQLGVRRELTAQWNAVRRDLAANRKHLAATKTKNRADEGKWKKAFEERLKEKLETRPAGCKVAVAG